MSTIARKEVLPGVFVESKILETSKGRIEYDITEGELPVILSIHGGIGGYDQARLLLGWLDESKYRLLCPSRPGYLGTPLETGRTVEEQADAFAALMDSLGINKVAAVSISAGGPPAYMFAIRHPDRIWALTTIDSVSGYYDIPEKAGAIAQAIFMTDLGQKIIKKIGKAKPEIFLKNIFQTEAYFTKQQIKEHTEAALSSPEKVNFMNGFLDTMNPYSPRKPGTDNDIEQYRKVTHFPVEKVQCPSLIIHGTHDADVKFYDGVYAYEHIPNSERYWIEQGSHLGFYLSPHANIAQKTARDFLEKHRP